ncbi:MAG TPA: serine/threonine-protein kinase, partial [Gemmataceae bacterium]|nr:serine/threonine-protein kinase [Gemmataceae bacterium]
ELQRSNLIERGRLDEVMEEFLKRKPQAEPAELAQHLVELGILTKFQAERVLQGKAQGLVLGSYVLVDSIGQGSMGMVHRAQSRTDGRWYAVKVLPRRSMWNVRLARRQVRSFSQFTHPAIVPFVDVGTSGGLHFLVWPFVEGEALVEMVKRSGKLDAFSTMHVGLQVAAALNVAHQNSLFHGLLKPSNIMIGPDDQVQILDFGIGSLLAENEGESLVDTMSTANALTSGLDCTSPESIMEPTNRTPAGDQYSLGCILYWCLSGRYPFPDGSAVEKMMAHQFKQPTPLAQLAPQTPPKLVALIERLMQKKPEDRYAAMDEVHDALQKVEQDSPAGPPNVILPSTALANGEEAIEKTAVVAVQPLPPSRPAAVAVAAAAPENLEDTPIPKAPQKDSPPVPERRPAAAQLPPPAPVPPAPPRKPPSSVIKPPSSAMKAPASVLRPIKSGSSQGVRPPGQAPGAPATPAAPTGSPRKPGSFSGTYKPKSTISYPPPAAAPLKPQPQAVAAAEAVPADPFASSPYRPIPGFYPEHPAQKAMMGPIGFVALVITVGLACFLAGTMFMK